MPFLVTIAPLICPDEYAPTPIDAATVAVTAIAQLLPEIGVHVTPCDAEGNATGPRGGITVTRISSEKRLWPDEAADALAEQIMEIALHGGCIAFGRPLDDERDTAAPAGKESA